MRVLTVNINLLPAVKSSYVFFLPYYNFLNLINKTNPYTKSIISSHDLAISKAFVLNSNEKITGWVETQQEKRKNIKTQKNKSLHKRVQSIDSLTRFF